MDITHQLEHQAISLDVWEIMSPIATLAKLKSKNFNCLTNLRRITTSSAIWPVQLLTRIQLKFKRFTSLVNSRQIGLFNFFTEHRDIISVLLLSIRNVKVTWMRCRLLNQAMITSLVDSRLNRGLNTTVPKMILLLSF